MKRLFDVVFSLIGIIVFMVPAAVICVCIKLLEHHPILFRQQRVGRFKKDFTILKFQTLVDNQPTKIGKVLRETGLDEVPQFINVLRGDMSIVGPRAIDRTDMVRMQWDDDYHARRWQCRPGITGYAQFYSSHLSKASFLLDMKYIERHNIFIDFLIIAATFAINILGKRRILGKQYGTNNEEK